MAVSAGTINMSPYGPYSSPGFYSQGLWLISKGGVSAVVNHANLPQTGQGYQYYWLGSTAQEAIDRLPNAIAALGLSISQIPVDPKLMQKALTKGALNLAGDYPLKPGTSGTPLTQPQQQGLVPGAPSDNPGIAGIPGLSDIEQFAVRALETLAGFALILLGLQALTGTGSGNPIEAVRHVVRKVK